MAKKYMSLRGKFSLAPITEGVMGAMRALGNMPDLTLEITADKIEHTESMSGDDTTDLIIYNTTAVSFSGTLEQLDPDNLAYILSGKNVPVATKTVTDHDLGAVTKGQKIKLDGFNLTVPTVTDGASTPIPIEPTKYKLDADYGTIEFLDDLPKVVLGYTTGAVTHTTIASDFGAEYALFFEGIDKISKQKVFLMLHRTVKSPDSSFDLIHEEFGSYEISGDALGDLTKDKDGALGLYGYLTLIPKAA
ncbi:hypothetical protein [Acinetobacter johnsonii]|uniref:phage tail tube protein n=1 Tax=Acinetobacter johnsonii TaxID=40214 RepID=UPI00244D218A|nr:hypothetical protein [Acinetobacter johnsonii]MDH1706226.1 hypothetical protein [Acinetobacter johnsonii]